MEAATLAMNVTCQLNCGVRANEKIFRWAFCPGRSGRRCTRQPATGPRSAVLPSGGGATTYARRWEKMRERGRVVANRGGAATREHRNRREARPKATRYGHRVVLRRPAVQPKFRQPVTDSASRCSHCPQLVGPPCLRNGRETIAWPKRGDMNTNRTAGDTLPTL